MSEKNKKITKELLDGILDDWTVHECNGEFEVTRHSPAGEEILCGLEGETLREMADNVSGYYDDFDPEDHAAQIYHAKHYGNEESKRYFAGAPEGLEDLLTDAKFIDNAYWELYHALDEAAKTEA